MKISSITSYIILFMVLMLITGCSRSHNHVLALWEDRQMDDDLRIYGNPYESTYGEHYIQFYITF
jgi:hypothetical protein